MDDLTTKLNCLTPISECPQAKYEKCDAGKQTGAVKGNYVFEASKVGQFHFICGVGARFKNHCSFGKQKAVVTVSEKCPKKKTNKT